MHGDVRDFPHFSQASRHYVKDDLLCNATENFNNTELYILFNLAFEIYLLIDRAPFFESWNMNIP